MTMQSTGGSPAEGSDDDDIHPGLMIGEYRVEGKLGQGGMGAVYSAVHPVIAKKAAIKILHPQLSVNREAVERFVQEARAVNQIGHPNIVDIFAFGTLPDGRSYFVMEWLRGESLRARMEGSPIAMADALMMLETVTVALEAAHEKGIVHRDLKPDNVFLVEVKGDRPTVKLLDFGIAKLTGSDSALSQRTQTGNMMGTPAYISPEQARGYAVDHRTDSYALGAMMYEVLTGSLVFPADNAADMIAKHLYQEPRPARELNANIPPPLEALLLQLLSKEAKDRPSLAEARETMRMARQMGELRAFAGATVLPGGAPTTPEIAMASHIRLAHAATPIPASMQGRAAMQTPVPGTMGGAIGTVPPAAYQTSGGDLPAQPPSRALIFALGGLASIGLGVGIFFAVRSGSEKPAVVAPTPSAGDAKDAKAVMTPDPVGAAGGTKADGSGAAGTTDGTTKVDGTAGADGKTDGTVGANGVAGTTAKTDANGATGATGKSDGAGAIAKTGTTSKTGTMTKTVKTTKTGATTKTGTGAKTGTGTKATTTKTTKPPVDDDAPM